MMLSGETTMTEATVADVVPLLEEKPDVVVPAICDFRVDP